MNFCKFTNETRLRHRRRARHARQTYRRVNGTASGGGYELALACEEIVLVDDRVERGRYPKSPLLGVLPGTGGLTRLVDKRKVRRDRADVFSTQGRGHAGRASPWNGASSTR